ncbi:MAG: hypothetical protein OEM00_05475 [Burkholderiaceae bacterium]|nr:hypothetical protein [Burkholderiaceae bacterium]
MTRSQKIALIALGVVSVLFVGFVLYGRGQQPSSDCKGTEGKEACANEHKQAIKRMRSVFSAAGPSIELPEPRYAIAAKGVRKVTVPAGSESMRTLKLRLESGTVKLTYVNTLPDTDKNLRKQGTDGVELPRRGESETSFAVTKKGGTLTMLCRGEAPCAVVPG